MHALRNQAKKLFKLQKGIFVVFHLKYTCRERKDESIIGIINPTEHQRDAVKKKMSVCAGVLEIKAHLTAIGSPNFELYIQYIIYHSKSF